MASERAHSIDRPVSWRIKERPGFTTVEFVGDIDERAEFAELRLRLRGQVVFHLGEVHRINSMGVRAWVSFIRDLPNVSDLQLSHCSPTVVAHLNMVANFRGQASLRSFYAPYVCSGCGREEERLLDVKAQTITTRASDLPIHTCAGCGEDMTFADVPERYLSFLTTADAV